MIAHVALLKIVPAVTLSFAILEQKGRGRIVVIALVIDVIEPSWKFQRDIKR